MPLIRTVCKLSSNPNTIEVKTPNVFGNQYIQTKTEKIFRYVFNSLVLNKTENYKIIPSMKEPNYASSHDIASYLVSIIKSNSRLQSYDLELVQFSEFDIVETLKKYKIGLPENEDDEKEMRIRRIFNDVENAAIERDKPYLSHYTAVSNNPSRLKRTQMVYDAYEKVLSLYPDIAVEFILIYCEQDPTGPSYEKYFKIGPLLKSRLTVLYVSEKSLNEVKSRLDTVDFPEYFFRNIGIRLSRGDVIYSGSSDVYPSPSLFEAAQRHMFSPFVLTRSKRIPASENVAENLERYAQKVTEAPEILDLDDKSILQKYIWRYGGTYGDLQGGDRRLLHNMQGWVHGRSVFHVDSNFGLDYSSMKLPSYIVDFMHSAHVEHICQKIFLVQSVLIGELDLILSTKIELATHMDTSHMQFTH